MLFKGTTRINMLPVWITACSTHSGIIPQWATSIWWNHWTVHVTNTLISLGNDSWDTGWYLNGQVTKYSWFSKTNPTWSWDTISVGRKRMYHDSPCRQLVWRHCLKCQMEWPHTLVAVTTMSFWPGNYESASQFWRAPFEAGDEQMIFWQHACTGGVSCWRRLHMQILASLYSPRYLTPSQQHKIRKDGHQFFLWAHFYILPTH